MSQEIIANSSLPLLQRIANIINAPTSRADSFHAAAWRLLELGLTAECDVVLLRATVQFPDDSRFHAWLTSLAAKRGNIGLICSRLQAWIKAHPEEELPRKWLNETSQYGSPSIVDVMPRPSADALAMIDGQPPPSTTADVQIPGTHREASGPTAMRLLRIDFAAGNDLTSFSPTGLSEQEPIGVWAVGDQSTLVLPSPRCASVELMIALYPNVAPASQHGQRFAIRVNGRRLFQTRLTKPGNLRVRLPDELTTADTALHLIFEHPDGASPASMGLSGDVRDLSVMLEALELHQTIPEARMQAASERPLYICAIFKNEAKYLYEWLSYHDAVGVDHFFLYNNNSVDAYLDVLRSWPDQSKITLIDWPEVPGQTSAYRHMLDTHRNDSAWCAFIDLDEYLCPQSFLSIKKVLAAMDDHCSGLYVHWLMFGSNGHKNEQPGRIIERFTRRAYNNFEPNRIGKTIVRLDRATEVGFCHIIRSSGKMINDSGDEIDQNGTGVHTRTSHNLIALNHYYTKSLAEWTTRRALGKADHQPGSAGFYRTEEEFHRHDQNVVEDTRARDLFATKAAHYYPSCSS